MQLAHGTRHALCYTPMYDKEFVYFLIICKSYIGGEAGVVLLTVHRCKGVCFAVNIHWIAKEREVIN